MTLTEVSTASTLLTTLPCPAEFKKFYCLNNSNCFVIKIESSLIYNCECPDGYVGQRCEFKNLDQSYLRQRYNAMLQQASLTSAFIVLIVLVILFILYLYVRQGKARQRNRRPSAGTSEEFREVITYETVVVPDRREQELNLPFSKLRN